MSNKRQQEKDFWEVIGPYQRMIYHVCYTHTRLSCRTADEKKTNDLYFEVVEALWAAWPKLRDVKYKTSWIYRVAQNVALVRYNEERRRPKHITLDELTHPPSTQDEDAENVNRLYCLIERLDDEDKELLLQYIDRVSQREIARSLNISEDAVNHRIRRIKDKLKKMNEDEQ